MRIAIGALRTGDYQIPETASTALLAPNGLLFGMSDELQDRSDPGSGVDIAEAPASATQKTVAPHRHSRENAQLWLRLSAA
jgi:hypothetical protein